MTRDRQSLPGRRPARVLQQERPNWPLWSVSLTPEAPFMYSAARNGCEELRPAASWPLQPGRILVFLNFNESGLACRVGRQAGLTPSPAPRRTTCGSDLTAYLFRLPFVLVMTRRPRPPQRFRLLGVDHEQVDVRVGVIDGGDGGSPRDQENPSSRVIMIWEPSIRCAPP
jgi:hypothetical protein